MTNYPNITISLYDPYPIKVLNIKQYDTGRGAMVTLTGLGGDVITPTGNGLYVYAKKRDGNIIYNTVTLVGSQVQIDFDEQMTVLSGLLQVEIQMIDPEGKTISTPIFAVNVMPSNIDMLQIESTSEFGALTDALAEVENLKQNGLKGDPGEAATIQIGTVEASDPGGDPEVTNSGTENAAVLDFTIPRGEPGSMWYQGDTITGTITSGTVFTGSGIENAELNDMYLNTGSGADKGNIYVCVLAGPASTAQWAYKQNIMGPTGPAGTANASSVSYDNETSGLTADNVQEAVDELNQNMSNLNQRLGIYVVAKYIGGTSFDFKSDFDDLTHTGSRQSVLIFGMINNTPMNGMLTIFGAGSCKWTGIPENVTATMASDGRVTVNLVSMAYDTFTMISGMPITE